MANQAEYPAKVSGDYRSLLLELTINYIIKQPPDCIDFALDFFNQKRRERIAAVRSSTFEEAEDPCGDEVVSCRRDTVYAGSFNPGDNGDDLSDVPVFPKTVALKKKLHRTLRDLFIFKHLEETEIDRVIDIMQKKEVQKGEIIILQGDEGDFFYLVESGEFQAYYDDGLNKKVLKLYENEGAFGELSLIYNEPRACNVKANTEGELWTIDRYSFRKIVVGSSYKKRKMLQDLVSKVSYLAPLTDEERMTLIDTLMTRGYRPGQRIFSEGEVADGMYFIQSGEVRLTVKDGQGRERELKRLYPGDYFGELALLTHSPRAASVYAVDTVYVAFLDVEAFERLLGSCWDILKRNCDLYKEEMNKIRNFNYIRSRDDLR